MSIADNVAIIGVGSTRFGELFDQSYADMVVDAAYEAFADAKVDPKEVQAAWLGTAFGYTYHPDANAGTSLADPLNFYPRPVTRVSNYCATGIDAVRNAALAVAAREYDLVLVVGAEKMRDVSPRDSLIGQYANYGPPVRSKGRTGPGQYALLATRYFEQYGNAKEAMAMVAVKNHYHGSLNPRAHFQKEITIERVLSAPMIAYPIGLFDCCPTTDGAAAVVLTHKDIARSFTDDYVLIKGIGLSVAQDYFNAFFRQDNDFLGFAATREAARIAYQQAGIQDSRREVDVIELHDCFTITELVTYEDLGLCEPGGAPRLIAEGHTRLGADLPVNTSGGLKACGHPIGATGVRMIFEITQQLRGRAGRRQVQDAEVGLVHNVGGPGAVAGVVILGR